MRNLRNYWKIVALSIYYSTESSYDCSLKWYTFSSLMWQGEPIFGPGNGKFVVLLIFNTGRGSNFSNATTPRNTLTYLIKGHARLLKSEFFSTLDILNRACPFINFWEKFSLPICFIRVYQSTRLSTLGNQSSLINLWVWIKKSFSEKYQSLPSF